MIDVKVTRKDYTEDILSDLQRKGLQFVLEGGSEIQKESSARAPIKTGNLASSIQVISYVEDGIPTSETGPTAEYAIYVEYGTSKMKAQPFMEKGYNAARKVIDTLFGKILGIL